MLLKEVVLQAMYSLVSHRFRASLTMLGIAWGIVTVVLLMAYGNGFHNAIAVGIGNAFTNGTAVIWAGQTSRQAGGERAGRRIRFKEEDAAALKELGLIKYASPEYLESQPLSYSSRQTTAGVRGVAPEYALMRSEIPETGRFINAEDVEKQRRVVFIGSEVARKLFGNSPAVNQIVRIRGLSFDVIGVLAKKPQLSSYFYPDKYSAFVPYTTIKQIFNQDFVDDIVIQTINPSAQPRALKQVRETLAARHRFDPRDDRAVRINDSVENNQIIAGITNGLKVVLIFIGSLTLMIGGVGVMNIMLVSVTERTREIGIRKALGARRRHILVQFLLEAITVTFLGGILGVLISYGLVSVIGPRRFLAELIEDTTLQTDIHLLLSTDVVLAATGILIVVGLFSGLWPAIRASRMDPIEALRYE